MPKTRRTELQQLVIPEPIRSLLDEIAEQEDRSKSAVVRMMIIRRAEELGIIEPQAEPGNA